MRWEQNRSQWGGELDYPRCHLALPDRAYVPCGRNDVIETPALWTVRDDPAMRMPAKLIEVVHAGGGNCFAQTLFRDGDYCVPDEATTTKRIFGLLAQLIAIQTQATDLSITPVVRVIQ